MRTVKMQISVGLAEQLISTIPRDAVLDVFEGSLTDSYVVDFGASKKYKIGRMLCRRYLVAREIYLNAWSSVSMPSRASTSFLLNLIEFNRVDS